MEYKSSIPYPPVKVNGKNPNYALAMLSNMGGKNSEMSAVAQYFYNHLVTEQRSKELGDMYHHISIVEMHHLEIFGELACLLGADPRLWEKRRNGTAYWSPGYLCYFSSIKEILSSSLKAEQEAIQKYEMQRKTIQDENITCLLERIIIDENIHVELFKEQLKKC